MAGRLTFSDDVSENDLQNDVQTVSNSTSCTQNQPTKSMQNVLHQGDVSGNAIQTDSGSAHSNAKRKTKRRENVLLDKKTVPISARIAPGLKDQLQKYAKRKDITLSAALSLAIYQLCN